ncbi:MAG: U32 family peptidase [Lachnospiraceae bacterium]|jgi:putative protease|nr:U32 family peptidase [Lachnospiraceae bacterium]
MRTENSPELLVPASDLETLKVAVKYGADAVYIGGEAYGLRANAKNFSNEDIKEAVDFAHENGVKVYVTVNILAHNGDLIGVRQYLKELKKLKPDALIIADPGIFAIAKEICPEIERHISTQANNTNIETFLFWYNLGARRVVCARELSLKEIAEIRKTLPEGAEIECFVHGSMCISYSGRCLLSNLMAGRDANAGDCTHPCRWKYCVVEESRPGEYMPVFENDRGTFIFNSKDLCMIEYIPELFNARIDSLKIEGRMKNPLYVALVTRAYRKALDDFSKNPETYLSNIDTYLEWIMGCTRREFTTGFYFGKPGPESQNYGESTYYKEYTYLGCASGNRDGLIEIVQKNKFCVGDEIEIIMPDGNDIKSKVKAIYDERGNSMESAPHAKQRILVDVSVEADPFTVIRKRG